MANTSFTLTDHWDAFIKRQVASGRYGSGSEVMREALRQMEARERKLSDLRTLVDERWEAADRGEVVDLPEIDEVMDAAGRRRSEEA